MTYEYLHLVNRLCKRLNEVPLTSSTFAAADGVYADFKESINSAIRDICSQQDTEWPFLWQDTSFTTVIGTGEYSKAAGAVAVDWDSFYIKKPAISVTSITQSAGTATATVSAGHQLVTGDSVYLLGADQTDYVGSFSVTVTSSTVFTFTVSSSATSPATGTILMYPPYSTKKLTLIDYDKYRQEGELESDTDMYLTTQYSKPERVVRKPDNNFILTHKPDRIYTVGYQYYGLPTALSAYTDVPIIPEFFEDTIVEGAMVLGYFFRDNIEQTSKAEDTYRDKLSDMRRILIPQTGYMRVSN